MAKITHLDRFPTAIRWILAVVIPLATTYGVGASADPVAVTLERDSALIPTSTNFPFNGWYKDVLVTPTSPGGPLMLYLPATMNSPPEFHEKIFIWNQASGAFVDETDTWWTLDSDSPGRDTYDADFIDIDGDGDADIVQSSPDGSLLLINTGTSFVDETAQRMPPIMLEANVDVWDDVGAGDVDGDGDWDLLFANRSLGEHGNHTRPWGPNILLYNDGNGFFNQSPLTYQLFGVPSEEEGVLEGSSHAVKLADMDNDGRLDLLIGHNRTYLHADPEVSTTMVDLYRNLGDANGDGFIDWSPWPSITGGNRPVNLAIFDFNHDGNLDLFTAGSGTDRIRLGAGDGTFSSSILAPTAIPAYDVAVGDINADGFLDVATPQAQQSDSNRALFLNDAGNALVTSNFNVLNDDSVPAIHLSTAFADVDLDGDLDMVWGANSRDDSFATLPRPTVMRNTTGGNSPTLVDNIAPRIENPTMFLATNGEAEAVFRVRIEDRLLDLDELSNVRFTWTANRSDDSSSVGIAFMKRVADLTYQANLSCESLQGNTPANVSITSVTGTVSATDVSGNQGSRQVVAADNLAAGLDDDGLAFDLNIIEPSSSWQSPVQPNDGTGRLFVRLKFTPSNLIPKLEGFAVNIGGQSAEVTTGERVGSEYWLGVKTPAGSNGEHSIEVSYRLCGASASDTNSNAVVFGDPEFSDTVLVVDTSGSMDENRKMESAIGAASMFINTMRNGENLGIVEFSGKSTSGMGTASPVFGPSPAQGNRADAIDAMGSFQPDGATSIGQGLLLGGFVLGSVSATDVNDTRALVLISDGMENSPHFWAEPPDFHVPPPESTPVVETFDATGNSDIRIHTVSLGPSADHQLMEDISFSRGEHRKVDLDPSPQNAFMIDFLSGMGTAFAAPPSTGLASLTLPHRLANQYEHFHNSVSNQQRLWQGMHLSTGSSAPPPVGQFNDEGFRDELTERLLQPLADSILGKEANAQVADPRNQVEIPLEPGLTYATVAINWEAPDEFDIGIFPPSPMPAGSISSSQSATNKVFRIQQPVAGDWRLTVSGPRLKELMITVSGISQERGFLRAVVDERRIISMMGVEVAAAGQPSPGDEVPIALMLFGEQSVTNAAVNALARSVAGQQQEFQLLDNGQPPDGTANDGIYTGLLTETSQGGAFYIEAQVSWNGADTVRRERVYPLNVTFAELDSDGDSISDQDESTGGLDPSDPSDAGEDPDDDGLPSWKELLLGLDPHNPDTDGGGVDDGTETCVGTDPLSARDDQEAIKDSDGDGMPDLWEERFGLDPGDPGDAVTDPDGDGLSNLEEFRYCTSPRSHDTDRDGVSDGDEIDRGTDPTDPLDRAIPRPDKDKPDHHGKKPHYYLWLFFILGLVVGLCLCWLYRKRKIKH